MLSFARATLADTPILCDVMTRSFDDDARRFFGLEEGGPPRYNELQYQVELVQSRANGKPRDYFKMLWDEKIVGGMVISQPDQTSCHLNLVFIDPDYQDRGIGGRCLAFLDEQYTSAKRWTLETPSCCTRNQHFYEKHGYVKVAEVQYDPKDFPTWQYERTRA